MPHPSRLADQWHRHHSQRLLYGASGRNRRLGLPAVPCTSNVSHIHLAIKHLKSSKRSVFLIDLGMFIRKPPIGLIVWGRRATMWKMILVLRSVMVCSFFTLQRHQQHIGDGAPRANFVSDWQTLCSCALRPDSVIWPLGPIQLLSGLDQRDIKHLYLGVQLESFSYIFIGIGFYCKLGYNPQNRGCIPASNRNCTPKYGIKPIQFLHLSDFQLLLNHGGIVECTTQCNNKNGVNWRRKRWDSTMALTASSFVHGWILQAITESMIGPATQCQASWMFSARKSHGYLYLHLPTLMTQTWDTM